MLLGSGSLFRAGLFGFRNGGKVLASLASRTPSLLSVVQRQEDLLSWSDKQRREFSQLNTQKQLIALKPNSAQLQLLRNSGSGSHTGMFKIERLWAVGMLPLFPAAYFIHNPLMDYALGVALAMHIHWGLHMVMEDYARPFVLGPTLSKICANAVYIISILMFAGLLHFNYSDVGITKAFEMVWSL